MGMDMISFIETCCPEDQFSGVPEIQAYLLAEFCVGRDYDLFDALADARSTQAEVPLEERRCRALYPARGIPPDLSLTVAWRYYDLIVESELPDKYFWPTCDGRAIEDPAKRPIVSPEEAQKRVATGEAHYGVVAQDFNEPKWVGELLLRLRRSKKPMGKELIIGQADHGYPPLRVKRMPFWYVLLWPAVSKGLEYKPSWLYPREIRETLAANQLTEDEVDRDFRICLRALEDAEKEIGKDRVRLTFWFTY